MAKNLLAVQETHVQSLHREDSLEKEMASHSSKESCLKNPMDRGAWLATESDTTEVTNTTPVAFNAYCLCQCNL